MSSLALPAQLLAWDFNPNQLLPGLASIPLTAQQNTRLEKDGMKSGLFSSPWVTVGSSNSVAGALDGADRWTNNAAMVWANNGVAHSWWVGQRSDGLQMLIDLSPADANNNRRYMATSKSGFTGGSNTTRPTALDEIEFYGNGAGAGTSWGVNSTAICRLHQWQSQNGEEYRMTLWSGNVPVASIMLGNALDAVDNWTDPWWACALNGANSMSAQGFTTPATGPGKARAPVGRMALHLYGPGFGNGGGGGAGSVTLAMTQLTAPNEISNKCDLPGVGLASLTAGARGCHGAVKDLYWGSVGNALGLNFPKPIGPAPADYRWVQQGSLLLPNNNITYVFA